MAKQKICCTAVYQTKAGCTALLAIFFVYLFLWEIHLKYGLQYYPKLVHFKNWEKDLFKIIGKIKWWNVCKCQKIISILTSCASVWFPWTHQLKCVWCDCFQSSCWTDFYHSHVTFHKNCSQSSCWTNSFHSCVTFHNIHFCTANYIAHAQGLHFQNGCSPLSMFFPSSFLFHCKLNVGTWLEELSW